MSGKNPNKKGKILSKYKISNQFDELGKSSAMELDNYYCSTETNDVENKKSNNFKEKEQNKKQTSNKNEKLINYNEQPIYPAKLIL